MKTLLASRTLLSGAMVLVPALLFAAGYSGLTLAVNTVPWLGLLICAHILLVKNSAAAIKPDDNIPLGTVLSERLIFERTTTAILEDFIHCGLENFDEDMNRVLARLGGFTGVDRFYLYRFVGESQQCVRLLHWQASGETALPPLTLHKDESSALSLLLSQHKALFVDADADMDHPLLGIQPWTQPKTPVQLCGLVQIWQDDKILGFLGFDDGITHELGPDEKNLCKLVAGLFSTMFSRLDAQQAQLEAISALKDSSKAKSEFLANMSHEIRTPLNGVIGAADVLKASSLTVPQQEYVNMISESGTLLMDLITDVLDLSKIEAGQVQLEEIETDLRAMLEDQIALTALMPQAQGLELVCRMAPDVPERALLDSGRVRQVLTNLLHNASKFTADGHIYVNIETGRRHDDHLDLRFHVADTGIGISPSQAENLFEKFTQADASTTRRYGGTGLGLSICRQLVGLMGGNIWATGEVGKGATFSFAIPVKPVLATKLVEPAKAPRNVLIFTKNKLGRTILAERIISLRHRCRVAKELNETHELLSHAADGVGEPWHLIILDPQSLAADIDSLLVRIQEMPADRRPIVVLLAKPDHTMPALTSDSDYQAVILTKPVRKERLLELLSMENEEAAKNPAPLVGVQPESTTGSATGNLQVLLAEDNLFNQKVACGLLGLLGCQVSLATNGVEALAMVQDEAFDLILMDCQMPNMDGFEATRRIRQLPGAVAHTPIIALTANAFHTDRENCLAVGMNDFMTKPMTKDQLSAMIAKWQPARVPTT